MPPVLVREEALEGTGYFPEAREQIYEIEKDELFLTGTSEVALAGLHADQILDAADLPLRYCAFSTCFRREAGAAGRDTRGIFRVHQFDKVEMFSFVEPSASRAASTSGCWRSRSGSSASWRSLTGWSTSRSATSAPRRRRSTTARPGSPRQERYREVTSCSNTTDYQARRLGCRYRPGDGESPEAVHTLNGTAVAVGRTIIALIENRQEADGSFSLPNSLHRYGCPDRIQRRNEHHRT